MRSIWLCTNVLVDIVLGVNTREEVHWELTEALSADAVTHLSGLKAAWWWSAWHGCVWTSHSMIEPWIPGSVELALFFVAVFPSFFLWRGRISFSASPLIHTIGNLTLWPLYSLILLTSPLMEICLYEKYGHVCHAQTFKGFSKSQTVLYLQWFNIDCE